MRLKVVANALSFRDGKLKAVDKYRAPWGKCKVEAAVQSTQTSDHTKVNSVLALCNAALKVLTGKVIQK